VPQDPHHRVAQHCIRTCPMCAALFRIDARMLDDDFSVLLCVLCVSALSSLSVLPRRFPLLLPPKCRAVEKRIQIPATRHFNLGNPVDPAQTVRNLLRNLSRRLLQPLRQFKTHRRSRLPISICGGRSSTIASSTPYFSRMCPASTSRNRFVSF